MSNQIEQAMTPERLWERISTVNLFKAFTEEQRAALQRSYQRGEGIRLRRFSAGELACKKGEYELDLCVILSGAVDLFDEVVGRGRTRVATLPAGAFYGELGALGGLPRSTDIVAAETPTELLYIPRHCLKFIEANQEARAILVNRYRERAVRVVAQNIELFEGVPSEFIDLLIANCEIQRFDLRGIAIIRQGEEGDAFYIVRDGFVQVVREREDGSRRVLHYLRTGEYFGEMALLGDGRRYASVLTAGKCEVIKIPRDLFLRLCREHPEVEARVRAVIEARHKQEERVTPELSALLERSGQLGMIQADALLVMDLDLCVKCDNCVKACESLHGESRLIRTGIQLGKYLVPAACRHCDDPKCMTACPTGAVKRRPEGEIYFQYDMCIGCANCAIACPYDNIAMIETHKFDRAQARKARTMGDKNFFRPYPVAGHAAEPGTFAKLFAAHESNDRERIAPTIWQRILGRNRETAAAVENPAAAPKAAEAEAPKPHIPVAFPIKCDLCDGLPFMGCVHACPTGAAMRIDPATLFAETGAVSAGSRVGKARGGHD